MPLFHSQLEDILFIGHLTKNITERQMYIDYYLEKESEHLLLK